MSASRKLSCLRSNPPPRPPTSHARRLVPIASSGSLSAPSVRTSPGAPPRLGTTMGLPTFSRSWGARPPMMQLMAVANVRLSIAVSPPGRQVSTCLEHSSVARNHVLAASAFSSAPRDWACHSFLGSVRADNASRRSRDLRMCSSPAVSTRWAALCALVPLRNAAAAANCGSCCCRLSGPPFASPRLVTPPNRVVSGRTPIPISPLGVSAPLGLSGSLVLLHCPLVGVVAARSPSPPPRRLSASPRVPDPSGRVSSDPEPTTSSMVGPLAGPLDPLDLLICLPSGAVATRSPFPLPLPE